MLIKNKKDFLRILLRKSFFVFHEQNIYVILKKVYFLKQIILLEDINSLIDI